MPTTRADHVAIDLSAPSQRPVGTSTHPVAPDERVDSCVITVDATHEGEAAGPAHHSVAIDMGQVGGGAGSNDPATLMDVVIPRNAKDERALEDFLADDVEGQAATNQLKYCADVPWTPRVRAEDLPNLRATDEGCCERAAKATVETFNWAYGLTAGLFGAAKEQVSPAHPYTDLDAEKQRREDEIAADRVTSGVVRTLGLGRGTKAD